MRRRSPTGQLERVASRGRFVFFVALQREGGDADVEVGAVGPLDAKRPPGDRKKSVKPAEGEGGEEEGGQ